MQMMAPSRSVEGNTTSLPYYVKKTGTAALPSPKYPLSDVNGDCKSGVKNVLDGHVWTLEPEDPSNKVSAAFYTGWTDNSSVDALVRNFFIDVYYG